MEHGKYMDKLHKLVGGMKNLESQLAAAKATSIEEALQLLSTGSKLIAEVVAEFSKDLEVGTVFAEDHRVAFNKCAALINDGLAILLGPIPDLGKLQDQEEAQNMVNEFVLCLLDDDLPEELMEVLSDKEHKKVTKTVTWKSNFSGAEVSSVQIQIPAILSEEHKIFLAGLDDELMNLGMDLSQAPVYNSAENDYIDNEVFIE